MAIDRNTASRAAAGLCLLAGWLLATPAPAQEAVAQAPSLRWVPADAAGYNVLLRNRAQLEAVLKSKAWARLNALPFVQLGRQLLEAQWANADGPLGAVRDWYEQPDNADLVRFVGELFEEEFFAYAGKNTADFVVLLQEVQAANQLAPLMALLQANEAGLLGGPDAIQQSNAQLRALLEVLAKNTDRLRVPDLVLGFRLSRTKPAQAARRLAKLDRALASAVPALQKHLKKTKIHGADVHTLVLDGSLIPWDEIPLEPPADKKDQFDKLLKHLKEMKLTVAFGVRGNYVLFSVGEGTAGLQALGEHLPQRLSERRELAPLSKAAGRHLTSIAYVSRDYQAATAGGGYSVENLANWMHAWLKESGLKAKQRTSLEKDLKNLAADLKRLAPEPGANLAFSFLTDKGYEGYQYDWSKKPGQDGSRPLNLLQHVGGRPVAFSIEREQLSAQSYDLLARLLQTIHQYAEELAVPKLPAEARQVYEKFMKDARPLFARLHKATGQMLLPSLDGEGGLVLDNRLSSTQWHQQLPPSAKALPLLEPAVVLGVRDAALFRQAFHEYRAIFNGLAAALTRAVGTEMPEIRIPEPQVEKTDVGTLYFFPLLGTLGLDPKLVPTGGLSAKVAVFTLSQDHAKRLLTPTALKGKGGLLEDARRPLTGAAYFRWAGLMDTVAPWLDYALTQAGAGNDVMDQVQTVIKVLKVFRSVASVTYLEDGAVVTRSQTIFRDLE